MSTHQSGKGHCSFLREVKASGLSSCRIMKCSPKVRMVAIVMLLHTEALSCHPGRFYSGRLELSHRLQPGYFGTLSQCCPITN